MEDQDPLQQMIEDRIAAARLDPRAAAALGAILIDAVARYYAACSVAPARLFVLATAEALTRGISGYCRWPAYRGDPPSFRMLRKVYHAPDHVPPCFRKQVQS